MAAVTGMLVAVPAGWMPTVVEITVGDGGVEAEYNETAAREILAGPDSTRAGAPASGGANTTEPPQPTTAPTRTAGGDDAETVQPTESVADDREERAAEMIHQRVNAVREEEDLRPLGYSSILADVAGGHSRDMAEHGYFDHTDSEGRTVSERYDVRGVGCAGGENLFRYSGTSIGPEALAERAVTAWMNSPGHRENVLRRRFDREGVGVVYGTGSVYVTQNFC